MAQQSDPANRPDPAEETIWQDIISGKLSIDFEFLAARLLQGALIRSFNMDPSPQRLRLCARELRDLFIQNLNQPAVRNDLRKVLG